MATDTGTRPLAEILDVAGLVTDGDQVAPPRFDFARWRADRQVEHIAGCTASLRTARSRCWPWCALRAGGGPAQVRARCAGRWRIDRRAAQLDSAYDRVEGELRWFEHVTTQGINRIRATITIEGRNVWVDTNSQARMDRVLDVLRALQPTLSVTKDTRRPAEDVQEAMSRAPGGFPTRSVDTSDPQIAAALEQVTRSYEDAWLDEAIPALAGSTPREAAADPTRRPDLIRLLKSLGPPGPGAMDADRLRAALGL